MAGEMMASRYWITPEGEKALKEYAKVSRCESLAKRGTGEGVCDEPLDEHGNCPKARSHLD